MEQNDVNRYKQTHNDNRLFTGLILLAAGGLLLASKMGAPIPGWIFSWPVLIMVIGLLIGFKSNFKNPGWIILVAVGGFYLIDEIIPGTDFHNFIAPAILITLGFFFIVRPKNWRKNLNREQWQSGFKCDKPADINTTKGFDYANSGFNDAGEFIDVNAVFGSVKKNVLSKNFKGGEINTFMGGIEINLLQADMQQPVSLEVNAVFGGAKLILPANWNVKNDMTAVFGGVEDKRSIHNAMPEANKTLILIGTCVFGGIEINNF